MGLDFVKMAAPSFHKGVDRHRIELGTPTLFTEHPTIAPRTYAAMLCSGQMLKSGEKLGVRFDRERVLVMRGLDIVAIINSPPLDLINALLESYGEACGVIQQVHEIARVAEILVC